MNPTHPTTSAGPLDGVRVPTAEEVAAAEALLHVKDYPDAPKE